MAQGNDLYELLRKVVRPRLVQRGSNADGGTDSLPLATRSFSTSLAMALPC